MNTQTHTTRELLLAEGLKIASEKGLRGLVVRELALRAGVNLGSFVYHFSTRDKFIEELVEIWYEPMYKQLQQAAENHIAESALQTLQHTLDQMIDVLSANAGFINHLVADAIDGETSAIAFLTSVPSRHPSILLELIRQAQSEGSIVEETPLQVMMFLTFAIAGPMLFFSGAVQYCQWLPTQAQTFTDLMKEPEKARQRLHWALKAITI
jgi:AcrR family transcriptional regulator